MCVFSSWGFHTKAGDVSIQPDVFEVPLGRRRLGGVALRLVVHGEHRLLAELGVVVEADLRVEANHWRKEEEEETRGTWLGMRRRSGRKHKEGKGKEEEDDFRRNKTEMTEPRGVASASWS